jgi:two-component system, NtrC family, sensor kinase
MGAPIRTKLAAGLLLVMAMVVLLSVSGLWAILSYRETVRDLHEQLGHVARLGSLRDCVNAMSIPSRKALHASPSAMDELEDRVVQSQEVLLRYEEHRRHRVADAVDAHELREEADRIEAVRSDLRALGEQIKRSEALHESVLLPLVLLPVMRATLVELGRHLDALMLDLHTSEAELVKAARPRYRSSLAMVSVAAVGAVIMIIGLVILGYRWLVKPLGHLSEGVRHLKAGSFDHTITLSTGDEMQELAEEFNAMTAQLRDEHRHLERQVAEKSKQLIRSERLASLGLLGAGVAHEINNPLASIAGCAEAMAARLGEQGGSDEDARVIQQYLKTIQDEAFRCKTITERLLSFARVGSPALEDTDLNALVEEVIATVGHLGTSRGKHVEVAHDGPVTCRVNPIDVKQVVLNLTVNALDSMDEGGTLRVCTRMEDEGVVLSFADQGCGMTAEQIDRIFEPFFTLKPVGKGTGLGLSICHNIVNQYGGQLTAQSPGPGMGSTFVVSLPRDSSAAAG